MLPYLPSLGAGYIPRTVRHNQGWSRACKLGALCHKPLGKTITRETGGRLRDRDPMGIGSFVLQVNGGRGRLATVAMSNDVSDTLKVRKGETAESCNESTL